MKSLTLAHLQCHQVGQAGKLYALNTGDVWSDKSPRSGRLI